MARYFFDTSAFTKRYHPEIGSARIGQLLEETESLFLISNLVVLETQSAFAMKVRTGEWTNPARTQECIECSTISQRGW